MAAGKTMRLSQVARKLNVGTSSIVEHLADKGVEIENKPNTKIDGEQFDMLMREFQDSALDKEEASELKIGSQQQNVVVNADTTEPKKEEVEEEIVIKGLTNVETSDPGKVQLQGIKVVGKIDLDGKKKEEPIAEKVVEKPVEKLEEKPVEKVVEIKKEVVEKPIEKPVAEEKLTEKPQNPVEESKKEVVKTPEVKVPVEKKVEPKTPIIEKKPVLQPQVKATEVKKEESVKKELPKEEPKDSGLISAKADSLKGLTVLGKIELPSKPKKSPVASSDERGDKKRKRKRVRIDKPVDVKKAGVKPPYKGGKPAPGGKGKGKTTPAQKEEISAKEIQEKIKATMAKMGGGSKNSGTQRAKYRRDKRDAQAGVREEQILKDQEEAKVLKVTEFISANDLATLMDVSVNNVISACMTLGMFVSINQRLDAETITVITDEFGYEVEFTSMEEDEDAEGDEVEEDASLLNERAPVVTIMGHVDHGKTSLLDYIRESTVTEGEAGGITQHIGAYDVLTKTGNKIAFLDTPGHEAFTAMRARGARLTDIVIVVVAADDHVMPQTKEALNHAQIAGVPIIIAINKVDKDTANTDQIKDELSKENILVEDWGGKYQCQHISAKTGEGIDELLEKVLLEAEILELKANFDKPAVGAVVEASLDKGRGYVSTILVQSGTLRVQDILVAGPTRGRVRALLDHKGNKLKEAGPSTPVQVLGLDGAPQAGDKFQICKTDREAKEITNKRQQILREQSVRTKKHLTLDEIGRRLAVGNFKELNLIIKGDVDGSVEALTDSLQKLSTEEVQVNVIHKAVGPISESDVLLATASDAIILGFQVRPSVQAKTLAINEEIEIKLYSIIYKAIDEIKAAMEGLLAPKFEEVIVGNIEIRDVFKISKVGTVAGCYVLDGLVKRSNDIRIIREGVVVYTGEIGALKRFKDDVAEVKFGYECGLSIKKFNNLEVGDVIEAYEEREIKRKL